jgi:hypothetical protein
MMTIIFIVAYLCSSIGTCRMLYISDNNRYGWGLRTLESEWDALRIFLFIIVFLFWPVVFPQILIINWRYCFMSKEQALKHIDNRDIEKWGYEIGKKIAIEKGRLPANTPFIDYEHRTHN